MTLARPTPHRFLAGHIPFLATIAVAAIAVTSFAGDWPMWGGTPDRNMVSSETGLPAEWNEKKNLRWQADLGSQTYGNPVVSGGRVFIGTNNGQPRNDKVKGDRGVMMCFSAGDGAFQWQAIHEKLETGDAEDWSQIGICSSACVVGDRVYYVSNRNELVCCDVEGFLDGENDGPYKDETLTDKGDADFIWLLDMRTELGARPYQAAASSPVVVGDLVFVLTGHGVDATTHKMKNADAASFVAVDRNTGKVVWKDASPGANIIEGQWGSPGYGVVDGTPQVAFPGGDGWLYSFAPKTGELLWKFDCTHHEEKSEDGRTQTGNQLLSTPVFHGSQVLLAIGQNPEAGGGPGCLRAIDATKRGDITKTGEVWRTGDEEFGGSISTVAVHDGLVYGIELDGLLSCLDLATGKRVWRHDLLSYVWGSPLVADGKVFVRTEDGDVVVLRAGRKLEEIAMNTLPGLYHGTLVVSDGVLYMAGEDKLYAVSSRPAGTADTTAGSDAGSKTSGDGK